MEMLNKLPKRNSVDAQIIMRDFYENAYGIYPHLKKNGNRPLASVALHPAEELIDDSLLEEAVRSYIARGVRDLYNLSIVEFLELPQHVVNLLVKIADESMSKKHVQASALERELGQGGKF